MSPLPCSPVSNSTASESHSTAASASEDDDASSSSADGDTLITPRPGPADPAQRTAANLSRPSVPTFSSSPDSSRSPSGTAALLLRHPPSPPAHHHHHRGENSYLRRKTSAPASAEGGGGGGRPRNPYAYAGPATQRDDGVESSADENTAFVARGGRGGVGAGGGGASGAAGGGGGGGGGAGSGTGGGTGSVVWSTGSVGGGGGSGSGSGRGVNYGAFWSVRPRDEDEDEDENDEAERDGIEDGRHAAGGAGSRDASASPTAELVGGRPVVRRKKSARPGRNQDTTAADGRDSSRERESGTRLGWFGALAEKYGSVELENKGSVARDHLALERTFLAWLRTSLSFASIGIAVTQLFRLNTTLERSDGSAPGGANGSARSRLGQVGKPLGATFLGISILILLLGFHRYFESQHYVIRGKFPASRGTILIVSFVAAGLIVSSLVVVIAIAPMAFES